jgi:hypothetical protein
VVLLVAMLWHANRRASFRTCVGPHGFTVVCKACNAYRPAAGSLIA